MRSISGRTDPDYVSVVEVFDNLSHAEIHRAVGQLDPAALASAGELFLITSTGLGDSVDSAHSEIRAAIADGWRGTAAQQAADAVRDFEQAGRKIADVLTAVGVRLSQAGDAAESLRTAIAEPAGTQPDPAAALLDSGQAADNATIVREAENARLDAVQAMESIYAGAFLPTGSGVPSFPEIDTATGTVTASAVSGAVSGAPSGATPGSPIQSATASADDSGATVAAGFVPSTVGPDTVSTTPGSGQPGSGNTTGTATSTASAATAPATGASPRTGVPSRPAPGTPATSSAGTSAPASPVGYAKPSTTDPRNRRDRTGPGAGSHTGAGSTTAASTTDTTSGTETVASATDAVADGRGAAGGEVAAGMGAGAMGGLLGGALAASDQTRQPGGPRKPAPEPEPEDEDDEFLRFLDEEPTYLEPADEVNALIGKLEPTSPPVLGEWTERE
ncbi:WXG100 family type VII secretion target [Nocardia mangyaensis]|uniref:WXG100 family type VII secretion target n=1 Tax=Nocardia mangyaensis TaxID=2213200 RepID=UPI002676B449|nr:WXG100 family type VII secretion target [Nocardia mangyaensis]MDO3645411.1 WXG100 family type VII secretion target [Nocardia mangyaensis]